MKHVRHFLNMKDSETIRQGIVKNLCHILGVLTAEKQKECIAILWSLQSDSNWRFRLLLSKQLDAIINIYSAQLIREEIVSLIFQLCQDRMAEVRYSAVYPIPIGIKRLLALEAESEMDTLQKIKCITDEIEIFYLSKTYSKRLLFIKIADACFDVLENGLFDAIFFSNLLSLQNDAIFNVRCALARFICQHFVHNEAYQDREEIIAAIGQLKNDDEDVE